jgi:hypothetical protein
LFFAPRPIAREVATPIGSTMLFLLKSQAMGDRSSPASVAGGTLALPHPAASGLAPRTPTRAPAKPDARSFPATHPIAREVATPIGSTMLFLLKSQAALASQVEKQRYCPLSRSLSQGERAG